MIPRNPLLHAQNLVVMLDQYDENFDLYKSYNERLLINLGEVFNKTTLPVSAITGDIMSRGALKKLLMEKGGYYSRLRDIENLITVRVVVYFSDDIDMAVSLVKKEFMLNDSFLSGTHSPDQDRFGINARRFSIMLLPDQYGRVEYQRFVSLKAELEIRTVLQHSWSEVKGMFDVLINRMNVPGQNVNKLAQISYLLKMADDELVRIKEQILSQSERVRPDPMEMVVNTPKETPLPPDTLPMVDPAQRAEFMQKIEQFILNDGLVRELDRAIADHYETKLVYKDNFVSSLADVYLRIAISREDRMREELVFHKNTILKMIRNIFGDPAKTTVSFIHKGSSLLVLYYVLLAKTGNIEIIKNNIKDYVALQGMSVDEFANNLLMYYNKASKKEFGVDW
ncbi:MAG: hypothetical protein H7839_06595 [Magnetococcus sp. YQC-5]